MTRILEREVGTGVGSDQVKAGTEARAGFSWVEPIRRARRPPGATRLVAVGRMVAKRSTARRVTTSKVIPGRDSARVVCILTFVNVRARVTSRRKVDFFWLDSISVREIWGAQSFMGMPGNPAPEPMSARVGRALG